MKLKDIEKIITAKHIVYNRCEDGLMEEYKINENDKINDIEISNKEVINIIPNGESIIIILK